jgi:hypothetical protein
LAVGSCAVGLWGCGSSSSGSAGSTAKSVTVATVGGIAISAADLRHWVPVEAVIKWRRVPLEQAPLGVLPDPPRYVDCVAWLGSPASPPSETGITPPLSPELGLTVAQRRSRCERLLQELTRKALEFLITDQWYKGEVRDKRIRVTEADVQSNSNNYIEEAVTGRRDFGKYLAATGMSEADFLFVQRRFTNWEKIRQEILDKPHPTEVTPALEQFTSKWVAKTSCRPGYVVPGCSQYHGPLPTP